MLTCMGSYETNNKLAIRVKANTTWTKSNKNLFPSIILAQKFKLILSRVVKSKLNPWDLEHMISAFKF